MNLRDAVWSLLAEVADEADARVMFDRVRDPDLDQTMRFMRQVRSILKRLNSPKGRLRAPALARELEALELSCTGPLEEFRIPLQRSLRRAHALVKKNRKLGKRAALDGVATET